MRVKNSLYLYRQQSKTSEGEFIYELQNSYELSPKVSEQYYRVRKNGDPFGQN